MTETTQANEAADGQSQLTEVLGLTVQDIGCRLMQKHRLVDPDAFPVAEGVVVAVFDWGVRLAEPADMTNEWDCYTGNYVLPNIEVTDAKQA